MTTVTTNETAEHTLAANAAWRLLTTLERVEVKYLGRCEETAADRFLRAFVAQLPSYLADGPEAYEAFVLGTLDFILGMHRELN